MISLGYLLVIGATLCIYFWFRKSSKGNLSSAKLLPPGPWGLPVFGHLLQLGAFPPTVMLQWKQKYGPVYMINFGSYRTLILNDAKSIKEAFSLPVFSDRPDISVFKGVTQAKGLLFSDYHDSREQRQFMGRFLKDFGLRGKFLEDKIHEEVSELLEGFEKNIGKPYTIDFTFNPLVLNTVWGCLMSQHFAVGDPHVEKLVSLVKRISSVPSILATLGMFCPWLGNLLPGLTGVTSAKKAYTELFAFMQDEIDERKKTRVKSQPRDVTDAYIDHVEETTDVNSTFHPSKNYHPITNSDLFLGAGETTSTAIEWMILLLAHDQTVQNKLQEEISLVVGHSRFPSLDDRPKMPYTDATIHEVLRFVSVAPFGAAHNTSEDTEFRGFFIPKDTMIIPHVHGAHHDPEIWGDPENFRPERFMDEGGNFKKSEHFVAFCSGKRVCIGESLAKDELFLFITRIFQKFSIRFAGKSPPLEGKFGFIVHPEVFDVIFSERLQSSN